MLKRSFVFCIAVVFVAVAGCSGGTRQGFTPLVPTTSSSLSNAAVSVKVLHGFAGGTSDGATYVSTLVEAGQLLYGTTAAGGQYDSGTVFAISRGGTGYKVLYSFKGNKRNGTGSGTGLTNVGGVLYGVTTGGGAAGKGTVYSIDAAGTFKTLYSFKGGNDGSSPATALTNVRGTLYGTTDGGGANGQGTVFKISTGGTEKVIYSFGANAEDGNKPNSALVHLGGKLYGTTAFGGVGTAGGNGAIYNVTLGGRESVLYRFKDKGDGDCTFGCTLSNVGGVLYGTAKVGGSNKIGSIFSITTTGVFKTLYSCTVKGSIGGYPIGALANVGGMLFGTMSLSRGQKGANGTLFSMTKNGKVSLVYAFAGGNDAAIPSSSLLLIGNTLYGTSNKGGGTADDGTIYSVTGF